MVSQMFDFFICPVCRTSSLQKREEAFFCADKACRKFEEPFNIVNSKPVLIDFKHSLSSEQSFKSYSGKSVVPRRTSSIVQLLRAIFVGKSKKSIQNFDYLKKEMLRLNNPRILIVGGGELGSGMDDFYSVLKENIVSFDIYDTVNVQFVADAHMIPFKNDIFDLIIIQAVLEHVLDPHKVVSEITRVLKQQGIVYAETPLMQQVHEGPYDFTRFTESGHRFLFRSYNLISSGYISGVGSSLLWSLDFFFSGLFRTRYAGKAIRMLFFWLRFVDTIVPDSFNIDGACGVYLIGRKSESTMKEYEIVAYYQGSQK